MTSLLDSTKQLPLTLEHAEGVYVYDAHGRRFLDFYGGHAVCATGHSHPRVVDAIRRQAGRLMFYSTSVDVEIRRRAADKLCSLAPGMAKVFFSNSGAEAIENALKAAALATGRHAFVAMTGAFHGRSAGAMSVTHVEKYRAHSTMLWPGVTFVEFGDAAALEKAVTDKTAAVIFEPIQSLAGVRTAKPEFFAAARRFTAERGAKLIYDEVQTGAGRTGRPFFAGRFDVLPDLIATAKGVASGFPVGATLMTESIALKLAVNDLGSTFGGGPLAMAALEATLDVLAAEDLSGNAQRMGDRLKMAMSQHPKVTAVRGEGLLLGFSADRPASELQDAFLERNILVGTSLDPAVVRLLPPLVVKDPHVDEFLAAFEEVLR